MPKNGTAALALLPPASEPTGTKPAAPPVAIQVGEAVASAVEALGVALAEGGAPMRAGTRTLNGEKLAVVVELWLAHFGEIDDFRGLAQREGRRALLERHAAVMRRQLGAGVPEAAIAGCLDELCGWVITIAARVAAIERVFRSN